MDNLICYDFSYYKIDDRSIIYDWRFRTLSLAMSEVGAVGFGDYKPDKNLFRLYYGANEKDLSRECRPMKESGEGLEERKQALSLGIDGALAEMFVQVQPRIQNSVSFEIVICCELAYKVHAHLLLWRISHDSPKYSRFDEGLDWLTQYLADSKWSDDKAVISGCLEALDVPSSFQDTSVDIVKLTSDFSIVSFLDI